MEYFVQDPHSKCLLIQIVSYRSESLEREDNCHSWVLSVIFLVNVLYTMLEYLRGKCHLLEKKNQILFIEIRTDFVEGKKK